MSNIIRFHELPTTETRIIQTRKIESKKPTMSFNGQEIDLAKQKQLLLQEIEALEVRYNELQSQLETERETARTDINYWWEEKRNEAEKEAQIMMEKASAQGFQDGFDQGTLQAEEEFKQKRQEMHELIAIAYEEKEKIVQQSEPFLLSLSVKIAEKVIKGELEQHESQLLNIVKQALKRIEESEDVAIQVSAEDYPVILPFLEELQTYIRADSELKLIPVSSLSKGGCMIHTMSGSYDVTVDSQLQEIKKQLLVYCEEKTNDELQRV